MDNKTISSSGRNPYARPFIPGRQEHLLSPIKVIRRTKRIRKRPNKKLNLIICGHKLTQMCLLGNESGTKHFLCLVRDIHFVDTKNNGLTPLVAACYRGYYNIVKILLEFEKQNKQKTEQEKITEINKRRMSTVNDYGVTPIYAACMTKIKWSEEQELNRYMIVNLLLEHKANPFIMCQKNKYAFINAIIGGSVDIVKRFIELGQNVDQVLNNSYTSVSVATELGLSNIVKLLAKNGANLNYPRSTDGMTPISIASYNDDVKIVKILLNYGADPSFTSFENELDTFSIACKYNSIETAKFLYDNLDPHLFLNKRVSLPLNSINICQIIRPRNTIFEKQLVPKKSYKIESKIEIDTDKLCIVCMDNLCCQEKERLLWSPPGHNCLAKCKHGDLLCSLCCSIVKECPYCRSSAYN